MKYMLLIHTDETTDPEPGQPGFEEMMTQYGAFTAEIRANGVFETGDPLQGVATATTVRVRNGKTEISDGPYAETKEQLGGYYILNCKNIDEAIGYAAKIPGAQRGAIEVRPVMDMG